LYTVGEETDMSLWHGLNVRQKIAAASLTVAALAGVATTGNSYLERTKTKPAHKGKAGSTRSDVANDTVTTTTNSRPALGSVNINTADESELDQLPGVGPATAKKIVEYRSAHGGFQSVDELDQVKGIGPKKLEEMRPYCRL
jgi:competence protein ComEA